MNAQITLTLQFRRFAEANRGSSRNGPVSLASLGFAMLLSASVPAFAVVANAPNLGQAFNYTVLGTNAVPTSGTVTCTDTGPGIAINGNIGTTANSITNTNCTINGTITAPVPAQVGADLSSAYGALNTDNPTCDGIIPTTSTVLAPGVYCSAAGTSIGTGVTLTLNGSANDIWVFKVGTGGTGSLTTTGLQVVMGGSARACNVYWRTAQAATLTDSVFKGTVMTGTAFTMTRGSFDGRGLAITNATVTDAASMNFAGCAGPTQIVVNKDFSDGNTAAVPMNLSCTSGTVATTPLNASESTPAVFSVTGANPGATCTATEVGPTGYTQNETGCASKLLGSSCTIVNTLAVNSGDATITVNKDFSPNSNALVPVTLACTNNMVPVVATLNAAEGTPAIFVLRNPTQGTTCTATETVPLGYTANQTGCVGVALNGSCTMTNTLITAPSTIPTLSEWALIMISAMLGMAGFAASRKKA